MPVIEVKAVRAGQDVDVCGALNRVCAEVAGQLGLAERDVWGQWETLESRPGGALQGASVVVTAMDRRAPEQIQNMLSAVANVLATDLAIAQGDVLVSYSEPRSGRVFSGKPQ